MNQRAEVACLGVADVLDLHRNGDVPDQRPGEQELCQPREASNPSRHLGVGEQADHHHDVVEEDRIPEGDLQSVDPFEGVLPDTGDGALRDITTTDIGEEVRGEFVDGLGAHSGGNVQEVNHDLLDDRPVALDREHVRALHVAE